MAEIIIGITVWAFILLLVYGAWILAKYAWQQLKLSTLYLRAWGAHIMAKWRKSFVADIVFDALFEAAHKDQISFQEMKRMCTIVGRALDLPDLLGKKVHKHAIAARMKKNRAGPKGKLPGPPPSVVVDKTYNGSHRSPISFLEQLERAENEKTKQIP